jgi:hypothetical protein
MRNLLSAAALGAALTCSPAFGATIFDNGGIDNSATTWNISNIFAVLDDFVVTGDATITGFEFSFFAFNPNGQTSFAIFEADRSTQVVTPTAVTGVTVENGLTRPGSRVGYTRTISGLDIDLSAGRYFLGLEMNVTLAGIATGNGGPDTFFDGAQDGLFHSFDDFTASTGELRPGQHMSFRMFGSVAAPIPLPASAFCWSVGLRRFPWYVEGKADRQEGLHAQFEGAT